MHRKITSLGLIVGGLLGLLGGWFLFGQVKPIAAGDDRHDEFIISTGPINTGFDNLPKVDGVWILDHKAGKLLASVVGKQGRIQSWAEVDLIREFGIAPRQQAHFMMTSGNIGLRSAMYIADTVSGKLGVYTMGIGPNSSIIVQRHDMVLFRANDNRQALPVQPEKDAVGKE